MKRQMSRGEGYFEKTFPATRRSLPAAERAELVAFMKARGAQEVGFLPDVDPRLIFAGKALPERHAIVFTVGMDKEEMATAPSNRAFAEVMGGYADLGEIAGDVCDWLRARRIAAYPGTNIGGQTDYPAMAEAAGIGAIGYHGLLITPSDGARVRVSTIYVGIDDLPAPENPHLWVRDVCANCRRCVRSCPPGAIEAQPVPKANGGMRAIRATACRDYFARNWGCAICLKVCPFSETGYDAVKAAYDAARAAGATPAPLSTVREAEGDPGEGPRIAIVGAGAAGHYLAKAVLDREPSARVDLIERLPFPHGLVRYGVAPDHPEVRAKGFTFDRILEHPRVRLLAGIEVGRDVDAADLRAAYDAVALAHGAPSNRRLGIEGEDLPGVHASPDLARWYNAHPDYADLDPRIGRKVVIVGHGNVALDTARMLLTAPEALIVTDMMPEAAVRIASARVEEIEIVGRSGPSQTSFTPKEIVELSELPGVQIVVDSDELAADLALPMPDPQAERRRLRNLELFAGWAVAPRDPSRRPVRIRFFRDPKLIAGEAGVRAIRMEVTRMVDRDGRARPEGTGRHADHACDTVIRAIGFRNVAVPGLPFDAGRARMPMDGTGRAEGGGPFLYATGWARRGPVGVIGTNKTDAEEVAATMLADLAAAPDRRGAPGIDPPGAIHSDDWADIAREEKRRGAIRGHGPLRFVDTDEARAWLTSHGRRRLNDPTLPPEAPEAGRPDSARIHA
jgi:ferredoxin--NADP+ reductase